MSPIAAFARERAKAEKKLEIVIDKLVGVQDLGFGTDGIARALEIANLELNRLRERQLVGPA